MTKPVSVFTMCSFAARLARDTGQAFVIIDIEHDHGSESLHNAFPTIESDLLDIEREPIALAYSCDLEAQTAFTRICQDLVAAEEQLPGAIAAVVRYVGKVGNSPVITTSNSTGQQRMHIFQDGQLIEHIAQSKAA